MCLAIEKKPRWKEKEERMKNSSFDDALEQLGVNKEFLEKEETKKEAKKKLVKEK
ncbi:MAG: hypothetical protein WC994_01325 [Brumimicrobium sp.]